MLFFFLYSDITPTRKREKESDGRGTLARAEPRVEK